MATEKYDKKLAELNLSVSLRELSTQHAKELNKLEEDLAARRMLNQGPGLRALHEFLEKKLQENLNARLKCITDSFYDNVAIDDETEKEIKASFDRFLKNEERGLTSLYSSRIGRIGLPKGAKKSASNGIKYIINKHRADLLAKLKIAILKHNKSLTSQQKTPLARTDLYVNENKITDLKNIKNSNYDLSKLIRYCEELNIAHRYECYMSIIMLVRSMLNHVPPIFGMDTFKEVANNYKYDGLEAKSFRASMKNLENSSRNIADSYLHLPVRKKESLPTFQQVNFIADLDVLLSEIVRVL